MSKVMMRTNKGEKKLSLLIVVIVILIIVAAFMGIVLAKSGEDKILNGISINNVDVGGMNKEEAMAALQDYSDSLKNKELVLDFNDSKLTIRGEDIDARINMPESVEKAYMIGKSGDFMSTFGSTVGSMFGSKENILAVISLNGDSIKEYVDKVVVGNSGEALDAGVEIKDDKIIVHKGHEGVLPRYDEVKEQIKESITDVSETSIIKVNADISTSLDVDLDSLYNKVFVEKKDASFSKEKGFVDAVNGVSFDLAKAKAEYEKLKDDESMTINLIIEKPEVTIDSLDSVLFKDRLATYTTNYNAANVKRSNNLELAGKSINNFVIKPGEEFSYNQTLGERTVENGYKEAHVYSGGEVVDGLGGGICQISSTLYNSVLLANLEVTSRKNHMFWPEYVKPSLDATVAWGAIDFKFKNNRETPIKLKASVSGGVATVSIYGLKVEGEPIVEIEQKTLTTSYPNTIERPDPTMLEGTKVTAQSPVNGYTSEAYKILKDPKTKEQISRTLISKDTYKATDKIVKYGTKKVDTEPTVQPEQTTVTPITPETPSTPTTPAVVEPVVTTPVVETTPEPTNKPVNTGWPTGWDTPENPYFRG